MANLILCRHNPTFLLPVYSNDIFQELPKTGRHTGTGSAAINTPTAVVQPPLLGYLPYTLTSLLARTGLPLHSMTYLPRECIRPSEKLGERKRGLLCFSLRGQQGMEGRYSSSEKGFWRREMSVGMMKESSGSNSSGRHLFEPPLLAYRR